MLCDLPSLVIRLGLTGHRPKRIGISNDLLAARVGSVLECLTQASDALLRSEQDRYDADAPMIRRFTCGLAPGADVVGAQAALEAGWTLQTILAFPRERFEELAAAELSLAERDYFHATFSPLLDKSASVLELDGPEHGGVNRNAYELVGDLTLEQSDVVLALWDGLPAQGLGGTAHLVRLARERGLPLVWIDTSVDVAPRVFLPGSDAIAGLDELSDWVRSSLGLSSSMPDASGGRDAQTRWNDYRNEKTERFGWFPPLFHWLLFFGGRKWPRWPLRWRDCEKTWNEGWIPFRDSIARVDGKLAKVVDRSLDQPFRRADFLAEYYGRAYRGAYVVTYLLAGTASLAGLLGLITPLPKPLLIGVEFGLIALIGLVVRQGARGHWHDRWLEYRALAEQLRQARSGVWCGLSLEPDVLDSDSPRAAVAWVAWYVRALVRTLPLINARMEREYLKNAVGAVLRQEISPQREFNQRSSTEQHNLHRRMEHLEKGLYYGLAVLCLIYLVLWQTMHFADESKYIANAATFLGAVIPAFGAILLGIRSQGEFAAYAQRTASTAHQLLQVEARATSLLAGTGRAAGTPVFFQDLLLLCDLTSKALADDVIAWHLVFRRKQLTVPV